MNIIINNNCLNGLKELHNNSVDCCVTSPPYYGLRDYGTATWVGGDPNCPHRRESKKSDKTITGHKNFDDMLGAGDAIYKSVCNLCGAIRVDEQIGLEETPEEYINKLVCVFREVKRVLKPNGTLWLNIGDSYAGGGNNRGTNSTLSEKQSSNKGAIGQCNEHANHIRNITNVKNKDLIGVPWMLAFALRADGWYLRQDIIWHKPNPMPESVKDRCTKSHEYIFLLSKSSKYYFDSDAISEETRTHDVYVRDRDDTKMNNTPERSKIGMLKGNKYTKRHKRDVWTITTKSYKGAHFAVFPEDLITPCVLAGCPEGGVVLDPFIGSGTTAVVAVKTNRRYVGIEINKKYVDIAEKRVASIT